MYKRVLYLFVAIILSGIGSYPVLADGELVSCDGATRTAGILMRLQTTAHSGNDNIPIFATGLSNDNGDFAPILKVNNNCITSTNVNPSFRIPIAGRPYSSVHTQVQHGNTFTVQVANVDRNGKDVVVMIDNLYHGRTANTLNIRFGRHLLHADVYMLSRGASSANSNNGAIDTSMSTSYSNSHVCPNFGVRHCLQNNWSNFNLSFSGINTINPGQHSGRFHITDSSVSLRRAQLNSGRDITISLNANTSGYYTLLVHFRCRNHCHSIK